MQVMDKQKIVGVCLALCLCAIGCAEKTTISNKDEKMMRQGRTEPPEEAKRFRETMSKPPANAVPPTASGQATQKSP